MSSVQFPLSPQQLEILSIFNNKNLSENDWLQLKEMIAGFFAQKSIHLANDAWEKLGWSDKSVDELLQQHIRTPYHPENQT